MVTIRVRFHKGVFIPEEPVDVPEGQAGVVMVETPSEEKADDATEQAWQELLSLVERYGLQTGIPDLAQHHDYYLYGPLRGEAPQ